jgi:hypothetical protein
VSAVSDDVLYRREIPSRPAQSLASSNRVLHV